MMINLGSSVMYIVLGVKVAVTNECTPDLEVVSIILKSSITEATTPSRPSTTCKMSLINENIYHLDAQLDKIQQHILDKISLDELSKGTIEYANECSSPTYPIAEWQDFLHSIAMASKPHRVPQPSRLLRLITGFPQPLLGTHKTSQGSFAVQAPDLIWLLVAKTTVQAIGLVANNFLERTLVLNDELIYWDEILNSPLYSGLYTLQTSPFRLWQVVRDAYSDSWEPETHPRGSTPIPARWTQFIDFIRRSIRTPRKHSLQTGMWSPFAMHRSEIQRKRKSLSTMKSTHASSIGLLMEACLSFDMDDDISAWDRCKSSNEKWCDMISRTVILVETILRNAVSESDSPGFEESISAAIDRDIAFVESQVVGESPFQKPAIVLDRLVHILQELIPTNTKLSKTIINTHGRPTRLVRYWLPLSMVIMSASTSLKILTNRRAELIQWVFSIGSTAVDFWNNWVFEPIQKLIGTIRHDEESEIAIMSKNSLEADRASLERMVADFITDHQETNQEGSSVTDIHAITTKVKEGDLTPVLKAYERDLRTPFLGTVRGDLVRALLIQVQKTKVDVEIAISGIDALLKSQQLVFGFVGLTPGILVSYTVFNWIYGVFGSRRGLQMGRKQDGLKRSLRNIDRTLTLSYPNAKGILSYKDHGLLICDTEIFLRKAVLILKGQDLRELRRDIRDLINIQSGIDRQLKVTKRIAWAYSK